MARSAYTVIFKWNAAVWTVTSASMLFLAVSAGIMLFYAFRDHDAAALAGFLVISIIGLAAIFVSEGYSPQCLEIGDESMLVLRRYDDVVIRRSEIVNIEPVPARKIRSAVCIGGSCGLFGFFGRYYAKGIGRFDMYATQFDNLFLVTTVSRRYVVGCAEPERLAHYLDARS